MSNKQQRMSDRLSNPRRESNVSADQTSENFSVNYNDPTPRDIQPLPSKLYQKANTKLCKQKSELESLQTEVKQVPLKKKSSVQRKSTMTGLSPSKLAKKLNTNNPEDKDEQSFGNPKMSFNNTKELGSTAGFKNEVKDIGGVQISDMRQMRQSVMQDLQDLKGLNRGSTIKSSIKRASVSFQLAGGTEAGDLVLENDRLKASLGILNSKLKSQDDQEQTIERMTKEIATMRAENKAQIEKLESENKAQIDAKDKEIDGLRNQLNVSEKQRRELRDDIEQLNGKIISFEEDLFESKTIQLDLLDQLKLVEDKFEMSCMKIEELLAANQELEKSQAIYIGHKHDKIDMTLESWMNNRPEKTNMNIMFLRESEGVYQFGQRRVYIKVEKSGQILVRVGGGFMHIDEFIDKFTQSEVDKIERRDVLSRFTTKQVVQSIATGANKKRETSPIRSPQRGSRTNSPGRKAQNQSYQKPQPWTLK